MRKSIKKFLQLTIHNTLQYTRNLNTKLLETNLSCYAIIEHLRGYFQHKVGSIMQRDSLGRQSLGC